MCLCGVIPWFMISLSVNQLEMAEQCAPVSDDLYY